MARLLTIVHISDLHVGRLDPFSGDAETGAGWSTLYSQHPIFDGLLGHHSRALEHLAAFYTGLIAEEPLLLVSGDVTRCGNAESYKNASSYLGSSLDLSPPSGKLVGLGAVRWQQNAIPGNHDRWRGRSVIFGGPTAAFGRYFRKMPDVLDVPLESGKYVLRIGMIDTDCDVNAWWKDRAQAIGKFQTQLPALATRFGAIKGDPIELRVLLMHHSWHVQAGSLSIHPGSLNALNAFLDQEDIRVLLTGHIHSPFIKEFVPVRGGTNVLECRCGTTTVHDVFPYSWHSISGSYPGRKLDPNTLLVHRISNEDGHIIWDVECYERMKRGFIPPAKLTYRFAVT